MDSSECWLPQRSWRTYEAMLRRLGEARDIDDLGDADDVAFLVQLGLVNSTFDRELTRTGRQYFDGLFVRNDRESARAILQARLLKLRPVQLIVQLLSGVTDANKSNVEALFVSRDVAINVAPSTIGTLLKTLESAGIVSYNHRMGRITVLVNSSTQKEMPTSIFVSPETPYSNIAWLRRILGECKDHIFWIDKHFYKIGLEHIWEIADGTRIQEIRILSLELKDNLTKVAREDYERLCKELSRKGISLEWRIIDSSKIRDTHDRWIIAANGAWNVPNVNAIHSGQRSELNRSTNRDEVEVAFLSYWSQASPV